MAPEANQSRGIDERLRPFLDALAELLAASVIRERRTERSTPTNTHPATASQDQACPIIQEVIHSRFRSYQFEEIRQLIYTKHLADFIEIYGPDIGKRNTEKHA